MAEKETGSSRIWMWFVGAAVLAVALFVAFRSTRANVTVRAATAERHDILSTVSTNGKVLPSEDFQAYATMPGVVSELYVSLGEHVSKGQHLVKMDDSDARKNLASARAMLETNRAALNNMHAGGTQDERLAEQADMTQAQAQLSQAEASLAGLQGLQQQGAASANEVAQARQKLVDAQARIAALRARQSGRYSSGDLAAQQAQVAQAQQSLSAAQSGYADVDIRAPFAGTVYALPVSRYDFVQTGTALLNVADLTKLQVQAYFDEPEIGKLSAGQAVTIVWDAKPNLVWHGHILQAPTTIITYNTRNVGECLISVDDAHGDLLPNTNVTVKVVTQQKLNALSLPREALRTEGSVNYVFKIVDGKLVRTPVQVGALNLTLVEILSGLGEHDMVALGATTEVELIDGQRVKVQK